MGTKSRLPPNPAIERWRGSALLLLVLGVRADHPNDALSTDNLAVLADSPDACSYLHGCQPLTITGKTANRRV